MLLVCTHFFVFRLERKCGQSCWYPVEICFKKCPYMYSRDLLKKALLIMQSRSVEKGPEIGTGTMLCRCISRMTSFVPFMRGGLRFMALPCCLVHCEVRQTQSSLHH